MTYNVTNRPRDRREQQILFAGTVIPAQSTAPLAKTASINAVGLEGNGIHHLQFLLRPPYDVRVIFLIKSGRNSAI